MLAKVLSAALVGIDAHLIDVEVDIAGGLPQFSVVGLPDATVRESRDRVRSALKNTGFHFPAKKITVNLAPAGIKKEGSGLDLAIAHWDSRRGRSHSAPECTEAASVSANSRWTGTSSRLPVPYPLGLPAGQTIVCSCRLRTAKKRPWCRA